MRERGQYTVLLVRLPTDDKTDSVLVKAYKYSGNASALPEKKAGNWERDDLSPENGDLKLLQGITTKEEECRILPVVAGLN